MTTIRTAALAATLLFPLMAACSSELKKRNEDLANTNRQLESELNQVKAERDEVRAREKTLKDQVTAAEESARLAREQASGLAARPAPGPVAHDAAPREAANARAPKTGDEALAKRLAGELSSTKATVETRDGRVVVSLPISDEFSAGNADLSASGKTTFQRLAKTLSAHLPKDAKIWVVGHTDSDPLRKTKARYGDNRHLSVARAMSVVEVFAASGIPERKMIVAGYGEYAPVAAGTSDKEKAKNRRVDLWID